MSFFIFIIHILVDFLFGSALLFSLNRKMINLSFIAEATAIGMLGDTIILALLNYVGLSLVSGFIIFAIAALVYCGYHWFRSLRPKWQTELLDKRLSIWEWVLVVLILEKLVWNILNLVHLPTYFDEALNHWSGKARALAFDVNWSWDGASADFLGKTFGQVEYPLFLSVWRATNFSLGDPMSATDRWDGLVIWCITSILLTTWIKRLTNNRLLAFIGVYILIAMPLQSWHISAGYAEIMIQCFFLLSLWSIYNHRIITAGIFTAAMIWSKNEGLVIFTPLATAMMVFYLLQQSGTIKEKAISFLKYQLTWMMIVAPWIIFKLANGIGLSLIGKGDVTYRKNGLKHFGEAIFNSSSSGIFWIVMVLILIYGTIKMRRDEILKILIPTCWVALLIMTFIYTFTNSNSFLVNQLKIHRSMLQVAPLMILAFCYLVKNYGNKKAQV